MRRKTLYIFLAALLAFSCTQKELEPVLPDNEPEEEISGKVRITFQVGVPVTLRATKALANTPYGDFTSLHLAVFGSSGYLKEYVEAQPLELPSANGTLNGDDNRYTFSVELTLSENSKRKIHLIGNGPSSLDFGYDTEILPQVLSPEGEGAYWQYIELPGIKAKRDAEGEFIKENDEYIVADETLAYFRDIALVRNFSKIIVEDVPGSNFETISFAIVNKPKRGTIAPYYHSGFLLNYHTYSYPQLREEVQYPGYLPIGVEFDQSVPSATKFENPTLYPGEVSQRGTEDDKGCFMYERPEPNEDQTPTSVIVYGRFTDPDVENATPVPGYYKVDLMQNKEYYPIYRNFGYSIQIKTILKAGASTPEEALYTMGSGDVSADVSTQTLTDISDGNSRIIVSPYMAKTLIRQYPYTENGQTVPLEIKYMFIPDIETGVVNNNRAPESGPTNERPITISLQTLDPDQAVIERFEVAADNDDEGFRTITIYTKSPSAVIRNQYIQIMGTVKEYDENDQLIEERSLYRNVVFTLLNKQNLSVACVPKKIESGIGEDMEVDITIPKGLPGSMFPITFNIEPAALSLTPDNNKKSPYLTDNNLPVVSGPSIIDGTSPTYHFVRTLSEADYLILASHSTGNTVTLPCYFKTNKVNSASRVYVIDEAGYFKTDTNYDYFSNYSVKTFEDLEFIGGVPAYAGGTVPFYFTMIDGDLPEKVYFKLYGIKPPVAAGLSLITDAGDPYYGWYSYTPSVYNPTINFVTTTNGGVAKVTLNADEYEPATLTNFTMSLPTTSTTIGVTQSETLTATTSPASSVYWLSDNPSIASVTESTGVVTGVWPGSTTITATSHGESRTCDVTVYFDMSTEDNVSIGPTQTHTITETTNPAGLREYLTWEVVDGNEYVSVNESGVVTGLWPGTAHVTASAFGETETTEVHVNFGITIPSSITVGYSKSEILSAYTTPLDLTGSLVWNSNNSSIASVASGVVTGTGIGSTYVTASAYGVTQTCNVTVRKLTFPTYGFYTNTSGTTASNLRIGNNQTVYFRYDYESDSNYGLPVTFTLTNLVPADDETRLVSAGGNTYTLTPTDGQQTQYVHLKSTTRYSAGSVSISNTYYNAADTRTISRSLFIPVDGLLAKGYEDNNSTKLQTNDSSGGSNVLVTSTKESTTNLANDNIHFKTNWKNREDRIVSEITTISASPNDDTVVYFRFNNSNYYTAFATLGDFAAQAEATGAITPITLHFVRWTTQTYSIDFNDSSNYNNNSSYSDGTSGITVGLNNCSGKRDWALLTYTNYRKDIGTDSANGTINISVPSIPPLTNCKVTGISFTYAQKTWGFGSRLNSQSVTINNESLTGDKDSWTAPSSVIEGNGETSVLITMGRASSGDVNSLYTLSILYGYYDF